MPSLLATPARALEDIALARVAPARRGARQARRACWARIACATMLMSARSMRSAAPITTCCACAPAICRPRPMRCSIRAATDEVLALLAFAAERDIAVVPYGGGTSVVGGVNGDARRVPSRRHARPVRHGPADRRRRGVAHRDGGSGHLRPRAREGAAREGTDARPSSAVVRVLDARRLDRASRRGTRLEPLWPRGGLARRREARDAAGACSTPTAFPARRRARN